MQVLSTCFDGPPATHLGGALCWMLAAPTYPDYDGFTLHCHPHSLVHPASSSSHPAAPTVTAHHGAPQNPAGTPHHHGQAAEPEGGSHAGLSQADPPTGAAGGPSSAQPSPLVAAFRGLGWAVLESVLECCGGSSSRADRHRQREGGSKSTGGGDAVENELYLLGRYAKQVR